MAQHKVACDARAEASQLHAQHPFVAVIAVVGLITSRHLQRSRYHCRDQKLNETLEEAT